MPIVMVMSIARPIKAGKIGPKKAGNQRKASQTRLNNKRPSQPKPKCKSPSSGRINSLTAAIRIDSAVISGLEVITRLGGAAAVVVTLAAEAEVGAAGVEVAAVSSVLRAHSKITSYFECRCIPSGSVAKTRNMLDIP
jgi:hypothetical protein